MILAGDFNTPSIDWANDTITENPQYGPATNEQLLDITRELFLTQTVSEPTRGPNTLDLIFATSPDLVQDVRTTTGISDHLAVTAKYKHKLETNKKPKRTIYMYSKANKESLEQDLLDVQQKFLLEANSRTVNENWKTFTRSLAQITDKNVPKKMVGKNKDLPYITKDIKRLMKVRKRRWDKYKKTKKAEHHRSYDAVQETIEKRLEEEYLKYLQGLFDDSGKGTGKLWSFIKSKKRDQVGIPALLSGTKLVTTAKEKAEALSNQYESVFTQERMDQIPDKGPSPFPSMNDIVINTAGVVKLLKQLNPRKAIGPDLVSTTMLRDYAEIIGPILASIVQQSINTGEVPDEWLSANISAIFKKGSKSNPANYRPISLTCVTCKVMEHIVFSSIMGHAEDHKILKHYQHGFRKGHSCESQLLLTAEEIGRDLDNNHQTDVLILDFAKAFDMVPHKRLVHKMDYYGIRGNTLRWITNWLTNRHQTVVVDGECSRRVPVISGVPQGSLLGPLLFLLYINDIGDSISSPL